MDSIDLVQFAIPKEIIGLVPRDVAERFKVIPVALVESGLMIAVSDPEAFDTFDGAAHALQRHVDEFEWVCATPGEIEVAFREYYGPAGSS